MNRQTAQQAVIRTAAAFCLFTAALAACVPQESASPVIFATLPPMGTTPLGTLDPQGVPTSTDNPTISSPTSEGQIAPTSDISSITNAAVKALAEELAVPESAVGFVSITPAEWSDLSLGCPQPDQSYPQVVTPGFIVALSVSGVGYEVHTDAVGTAVVCIDLSPLGTGSDPVVMEFIEVAKQDLADSLGIDKNLIAVVRSEAVEWTDSSLGCGKPDQAYDQVITAGYRIILAVEDDWYEYHTDSQHIFRCDTPSQ